MKKEFEPSLRNLGNFLKSSIYLSHLYFSVGEYEKSLEAVKNGLVAIDRELLYMETQENENKEGIKRVLLRTAEYLLLFTKGTVLGNLRKISEALNAFLSLIDYFFTLSLSLHMNR